MIALKKWLVEWEILLNCNLLYENDIFIFKSQLFIIIRLNVLFIEFFRNKNDLQDTNICCFCTLNIWNEGEWNRNEKIEENNE